MKLTKLISWILGLLVSIVIADYNPFAISGFFLILYFLPFFVVSYLIVERAYQPKGVFDDPRYLKLIQSIIAILVMVSSAGVKIPFLNQIIDLLGVFATNWDQIGGTVKFVLGIYVMIRAIFADSATPIIGHALIRLSKGGHDEITPRENYLS